MVNESLVVPAAGLFSLRFDLPQSATAQNRIVFNNSNEFQTTVNIPPAVASAEIVVSSGSSTVEKVRSYVLRVITPRIEQGEVDSSEDIELTDKDIEDLSSGKLFQKLGDNRYQIYLIREDGNEMLLKDFYLRNHRPFEIDESESNSNGSPTDERVLDKDTSAAIPIKSGGLSVVRSWEPEVIDFDLVEQEAENELKSESERMIKATLSIGIVAQTMRSLRKAARRFRAG